MTTKPAPTTIPIDPLLAGRWSPRALSRQAVSAEDVHAMLEAARWAPSSSNVQPWRFIVCDRSTDANAYDRAFAALVPFNQGWVAGAPVLVVVCAQTVNAKGEPIGTAQYDTGAAAFSLTLQAHALGLAAHQMAGFDAGKLRESFAIPAGVEVMAMIVVGHHGAREQLEGKLLEREQAARLRSPLGEVAYNGAWGVSM